jgi:glycosyltransferase involved in cell wall biosynthesis
MKILLIYLGRKGGGNIYSLEMAKALSKKCDLVAMISRQSQNLEAWQKAAGISLIEIDTYSNALSAFLSTLNLRKYFSLWKQIKNVNPDVIYYPMIHLWTPIINLVTPSIPKVTTIHDPIMHKGEKNIILELIQKIAIKQSAIIIILSKVFIPVIEKYGISKERISVIPHGEFSFYMYNNVDNISRESNTILFFGRIREYKGFEVLIEAFPLIKNKIPDAKLLIVGQGDITPYQSKLSNLKDVELFNYWIGDYEIAKFFLRSNVVVLPYTDATQSGIIPVAYMFKVPVISTNVGGIPEQVENGKTGILVNAGDPVELAEACIKILTNTFLALSLAKNGYQKAIQEWNWDKISNIVMEEFKKAIPPLRKAKIKNE